MRASGSWAAPALLGSRRSIRTGRCRYSGDAHALPWPRAAQTIGSNHARGASACTRPRSSAAAAATVDSRACRRSAHHSNSAYQVDQIVTLTGTVKEWRWMNPHTWLLMTVQGADGKTQEWAVEGRPPGILGRAGWNSTILVPGERVTVHASPAKNGDPEGIIARVTKADGTVLGNQPNFNREATAAAAAPDARRARQRRVARRASRASITPRRSAAGRRRRAAPAERAVAAADTLVADGRRLARARSRCAEADAGVSREVERRRGVAHQRLVRVRQHRELPAAWRCRR